MSLTLPTLYGYQAKNTVVRENWIMKLYYGDESSFLGIADRDAIVSSDQYYGVVNEWGEITEQIDVANSKAAVSDIEVSCANTLKYGKLSDELFGGSNKYINRKVEIYSCLNGEETLTNCLMVFQGILKNIRFDLSTLVLTITSKVPWANITVPQTKTNSGQAVPLAYGDFAPDTATNFYTNGYYYPIKKFVKRDKIYYIPCQSYTSVANSLFYYDSHLDKFLPLTAADTATTSIESVNCYGVDKDVARTAYIRPTVQDTGDDFLYTERAFDVESDGSSDETTYAQDSSETTETATWIANEIENPTGKIETLTLYVKARVGLDAGTGTDPDPDIVQLKSKLYSASDIIITYDSEEGVPGAVDTSGHWSHDYTTEYTAANNKLPDEIEIDAEYDEQTTLEGYAYIYDVYLKAEIALDYENEAEAAETFIENLKQVYCSRDGLSKSYSGGSGVATLPHEIHRDLMARFTDFDYADGSLTNWSTINTARSGWTCHWWLDTERSLIDILNQLQYEGCFIFKPKNDGGLYIRIANSYSSGDVAHTITEDDYEVDSLSVELTDPAELITDYDYSYQRHPAQSANYVQNATYTNSTARTNWFKSITNENKINKNLDFITADKVYNSGSHTNPNDCVALYYNNILANPRIILSMTLNNFECYDLEVGDIVKFNISDVDPFGKSWADLYFMVTETRRTQGGLQIVTREVYEA